MKDFVQEIAKSSQQLPPAAWKFLLPQRKDVVINHPVRVSINPNQEGTMEIMTEVLSSVGAQNMDTIGYHMPDHNDFDFCWEHDQFDVNVVFRAGIDSPFHQHP